jgi:PAS domain S-box-containing protein
MSTDIFRKEVGCWGSKADRGVVMKVLVAAPEALNLPETAVALTQSGYDVVLAADHHTVCQALSEPDAPKLRIVDCQLLQSAWPDGVCGLEGLPGQETAYWIAINPAHTPEDLAQAFRAGAQDYLARPFETEELILRVNAGARALRALDLIRQQLSDLTCRLEACQQTSDELLQDQAYLHTLLDNLPATIYFKDRLSRFTLVNRAQAQRFGLGDPALAIGKTDHDFFGPDHAGQALMDEQRIIRTGEAIVDKEERETWPDGRVTWVSTTKLPLLGSGGDTIGTFGISRDVTEHHKAEEDRRFLASIVEASDDAIIGITPNWTVASWNRGANRLYGYSGHEILGMPYSALLPPEQAGDLQRIRSELGRGEGLLRLETEHLAKDGRRFALSLTVSPVKDAAGMMAGAVVVAHDITARKHAEEEIYRSRQMLQLILDTIPQRVFWKDRDLQYLGCNKAFAMDAGFETPAGVVGKSDFDLVWSASASLYRADDRRVMDTEQAKWNFDEEQRLDDGGVLWLRTNKMPLRDRAGRTVGVLGTYEDITERKLAEEALAEEARLASLRAEVGAALTRGGEMRTALQECAQAMVTGTGVAFTRIWSLDPGGTTLALEASAGMYTHIDGPHGRIPIGHFKIGRIAEDRHPHFSSDVQNDPEVSDHDWARREAMTSFVGHPLVVEDSVVGVVAAFGRHPLSKASLSAFASVADQIARFIHGKLAQEAQRRSEERARLLFASIPHPAFVFDVVTFQFLEINDVAVERYGYGRDEFLHMRVTELCSEGSGAACIAPEGQISLTSGFLLKESKHRTRDGKIIDVEINFHTLEYDGRPAALAIVQDVTERRKLELELRHAQKLEAVGGLAAGIAHEINTPIQFVGDNLRFLQDAFRSLADLLGKYQGLGESAASAGIDPALISDLRNAEEQADVDYLLEQAPEALSQSLDGVERVATIVRAMKEFAHPDQRDKTAADLNQALASTLVVVHNEVKYVADIETDYGELPAVQCHLGDLNQVFLNLLINAAHAVKEVVDKTGARGMIRVKTRPEGDWVKISIADTGAGIPEGIRNKVFDPFFTTKPVGRGTGQGLAIARSVVVDKHRGTLTFESEMGRGTTFVIGLPVHGARS